MSIDRRRFLEACLAAGAAGTPALDALGNAPPRLYSRALLVDEQGRPFRAGELRSRTNYLFHYPYVSTPCFLLDLGRRVSAPATLRTRDGTRYQWRGGVGKAGSIVAFSAICAHKLAYPTREISFIRYQPGRSPTSDGNVIHCCADHSVYDPGAGAGVLKGPAEQPLAAILLDYDPATDRLHALGTQGAEQFEAFFAKYEFRLAMEYGATRHRAAIERTAVVREMREYCRQTVEC
jgi:Rieske Fe-S protein